MLNSYLNIVMNKITKMVNESIYYIELIYKLVYLNTILVWKDIFVLNVHYFLNLFNFVLDKFKYLVVLCIWTIYIFVISTLFISKN